MEHLDHAHEEEYVNPDSDINDISAYLHDSPEEIQQCLGCSKPECTNCLYFK